jgi:predicted hotdog family 3-hydroxylacyl-ACP dehydratase
MKMARVDFPDIDILLPHRGTMRLLDAVVSFAPESVCVSAHVDPSAWYADEDGAMPVWLGIELMAQAIGAHVGLLMQMEGAGARPGVLLGTQRYEAHVAAFARDARMHVDATQILRGDDGQGAYDCRISNVDGVCWAHAVIKVYQPADFQAFLGGFDS